MSAALAPDGLPPLGDVIRRHELAARKSLGQNFLLDLNLTRRIARTAGDLAGADVLEVGPGPGGLTRALLAEGARRVVAIERDARCLPALAEIASHYPGRLEIVEGDATKIDAAAQMTGPIRIVSNLPYNVGTALLVGWLTGDDWPPFWSSLTLMFQREVAERITARPGGKAYGRLSILTQWRAEAVMAFDVDAKAFTPPPKITSTVVHITPRPAPLAPAPRAMLDRVVAAAFNQRCKMLRQSLKSIVRDPADLLARAEVAETLRADAVPIEDYCRIATLADRI